MADVTLQEAKAALDELKTAFDEHKKVNDSASRRSRRVNSTAEFDEKLAKIAADMDKKEKVQSEYVKALEAKVNRITLGGRVAKRRPRRRR
jgi:hypothetical protein